MANVIGMILAIDDFFLYLTDHPELIPNDGIGKFIRTQFDKILKPTLLACLHAKGDKVEGNPAHHVAGAFYRNMANFLSHIIKIYAAREMPGPKLMDLMCEFIGTQREMVLKGFLGESILFEIDPDRPQDHSKLIFGVNLYSSMGSDEMPIEHKFIAAWKFYLSHAMLFQPVFHQNLSRESYVEYLKRFLTISFHDLQNLFIQRRSELHPAVILALTEMAKLDNAQAHDALVKILALPLEDRIVDDLVNSNDMVEILLGDGENSNLKSSDALVILQRNTVAFLLKSSHLKNHVCQRILGCIEHLQLAELWQYIGNNHLSREESRIEFMCALQPALAVEGMQSILGLRGSACVNFILDMQEKSYKNAPLGDCLRVLFDLMLKVIIADRFTADDLSLYMSRVNARNHCPELYQQLWVFADSLDLQQNLALIKENFSHYPEEIQDKLHKLLMNKCNDFTEDGLINLLRMYFSAPVNKLYLQDPQFISVIEKIEAQINLRVALCMKMPLEQLKLALKTFPNLHCLRLEVEKTNLIVNLCTEAEPERFALLKNERVIRSYCAAPLQAISNQLVQVLWRVQSLNDLAGVVEMTREVITAPHYDLLDLIVNTVPENTIKNIFARFGGNVAMQELFKDAFDRHCSDMFVGDFSNFIRAMLTNNALSGSKITVMHEHLVNRYLSQYSRGEALQLLVSVVRPTLNSDFTLNIDNHMSKFVATSIFDQLVKQICQYANENIDEIMHQLHFIHPVVAEKLYAELILDMGVVQQLVMAERFDRNNPLQTSYLSGNEFNEFAGRSLVSEYVQEFDNTNAVVALASHPERASAHMLAVLNGKTQENTFDPLLHHYRNHNLLYTRADVLKSVFESNNPDLIEQYCWKFILFGKSIDMLNSIVENLATMSKDIIIEFANAKFMAALVRKAYHLTSDRPTAFVQKLMSCGLRCQAFSQLPSLRALIGQLVRWDQAINRHIDKNGWNPPRQKSLISKVSKKSFLSSYGSSFEGSSMGSFGGFRSAPAALPKNILHQAFMSALFSNPQIMSEIFVDHATVKAFLAVHETYAGSPLPSAYVIQLFKALLVKNGETPRIGQAYTDSLTLDNIVEILELCRDHEAGLVMLLAEACSAVILADRQSGLTFLNHTSLKYRQELLCFIFNKTESGFAQASNIETIVADMSSPFVEMVWNNTELAQICCQQLRYQAMIFKSAESLSAFVDTLEPIAVIPFFEWLAQLKAVRKNEPTLLQQCLRLLSLDQLISLVRLPKTFSSQLATTLFLAKIELMKTDQSNLNRSEIANCIARLQARYPHSRSLIEFLFLSSHPLVMKALRHDHLCWALQMDVEASVKVLQPQDEIKCQVIRHFPINASDDLERQAILRELLKLTFNAESFQIVLSLDLKTALLHRLITELGITNRDDSWLRQCLVDAPKSSFKPAEIIFSLLMIKAELVKSLKTKNLAAIIDDVLFTVFDLSQAKDFVQVCGNADTLQRMVALLCDKQCTGLLSEQIKLCNSKLIHPLFSPEADLLMRLCLQHILANYKATNRQGGIDKVEIAQYMRTSNFFNGIDNPWKECRSQSLLMVLQLFTKHFGFEFLMSEFEKRFLFNNQPMQDQFVYLLNYAVNNQLFSVKLMTLFDSKKLLNSDTFLPVYNNVLCPLLTNVLSEKQWKSTELFITAMMNYIKMDVSIDKSDTLKSLLLLQIRQNFTVVNALFGHLTHVPPSSEQAVMLYIDIVIAHRQEIPSKTRLKLFELCVDQLELDRADIYQQLVKHRRVIPVKMMDCLLEDFANTSKAHDVLTVSCEHFMSTMLIMINNDIVLPKSIINIAQYLLKTGRVKDDNATLCCEHATLNLIKLLHLEQAFSLCELIHQQRQAEGRIFMDGDMMFVNEGRNVRLLPITDQDMKQYFKGFERAQGNQEKMAKLRERIENFLNLRQAASIANAWFWEPNQHVNPDSAEITRSNSSLSFE